ncbi:MAG: zinc ribbon domain-containing protein [Nitrospirota bacterium]
MTCRSCGQSLDDASRFCTHCGKPVLRFPSADSPEGASPPDKGELNLPALYVMAGLLLLALLFPPWETPPGQPPEFLGFHFLLSPPDASVNGRTQPGVVSRLLLTVELTTIAVAGLYAAWLFRRKP